MNAWGDCVGVAVSSIEFSQKELQSSEDWVEEANGHEEAEGELARKESGDEKEETEI